VLATTKSNQSISETSPLKTKERSLKTLRQKKKREKNFIIIIISLSLLSRASFSQLTL